MLYPHIKENRRRARPALVVTAGLGPAQGLIWALMITSAARADWPGDVLIADHAAAGLPIPSNVRTEKMATFEASAATCIGRLPPRELDQARLRLSALLAGNEGSPASPG